MNPAVAPLPGRIRPMGALLAALIVGILICPSLLLPAGVLYVAAGTVLAIGTLFPQRRPVFALAGLAVVAALFGAARAQQVTSIRPDDLSVIAAASGPAVWVQGVVASEPARLPSGAASLTLEAESVQDFRGETPASGSVQVTLARAPRQLPYPGDTIEVHGRLDQPPGQRNPNGFDYRAFLERRGIRSTLVVRHPDDYRASSTAAPAGFTLDRLARQLRRRVLASVISHLDADDAALLSGILLSAHEALPADMRDALARCGSLYVLSLSGLHLAALCGMLALGFRWFGVPRDIANPANAVVVWLLVLAGGLTPASERAAIALSLLLAAPLVRRRSTPLASLTVAAFLILAADPLVLYDAGFQIAFATVSVLLLYLPPLQAILLPVWEPDASLFRRGRRVVVQALLAAACAQIGAAPLVADYFNQLSLSAFVASPLLAPLSMVVFLVGFAVVGLAVALPAPVAAPLWTLCHVLLELLRSVAFGFAGMPWSAVSIVAPPPLGLVAYYALLAVFALPLRRYAWRKSHPARFRLGRSAPAAGAPLGSAAPMA